MTTDLPEWDDSGIEFPSDRINLRAMRVLEPDLFTTREIMRSEGRGLRAVALFYWERVLAEKVFARALGSPDPHPEDSRSEVIDVLDSGYQAYGLSTGPQQTRELIRQLEGQLEAQARGLGGRGTRDR